METIWLEMVDRNGRKIQIGLRDQNIVAEHERKEIAEWTFMEYDHRMLLGVVDMQSDYERYGIGTEMWRVAEDYHRDFAIVDHFTESGASFMNALVRKEFWRFEHELVQDERF
jgi:hypothetical protein